MQLKQIENEEKKREREGEKETNLLFFFMQFKNKKSLKCC